MNVPRINLQGNKAFKYLLTIFLLTGYWIGLNLLNQKKLDLKAIFLVQVTALLILMFINYVRTGFYYSETKKKNHSCWLILLACLIAVPISFLWRQTGFALWSIFFLYFLLIMLWDAIYTRFLPLRIIAWVVPMMLSGLIPVGLYALSSHFGDEEFFSAIQSAFLMILWSLLLIGSNWIIGSSHMEIVQNRKWPLALAGIAFLITYGWVLFVKYQSSFYPQNQGQLFPGITSKSPFLCLPVSPNPEIYDGIRVFDEYLDLVEKNPMKSTPELGMLALGKSNRQDAILFKENLLKEASAGSYTEPSNSVKAGQYDASLRIYYYVQLLSSFPDLFSSEEQSYLKDWIARINARALTVEWVDLLYDLAFNYWSFGPYENQENGAALLSLIEKYHFSSSELANKNQRYLSQYKRGWLQRFKNTDDAIMYQPIWLNNAYFQYLYTGKLDKDNLRKSFEWILDQAPPDGSTLQYNHPESTQLAGAAYLGAILLEDQDFVWLAGKMVDYAKVNHLYLFAQPGVEKYIDLKGTSPITGSCLLYSPHGLPNQLGPLGPDKIIIRDGWLDGSSFTLINLRSSGWHRYKSTGTIITYLHELPILLEAQEENRILWLPYGRSHIRDKRILRENLNGFAPTKSGLSAALFYITGFGTKWEQYVPQEVKVNSFYPDGDTFITQIEIKDWYGWTQQRGLIQTDGILVIADNIKGPAKEEGSIFWHVRGSHTDKNRIDILDDQNNVSERIQFLAIGGPELSTVIVPDQTNPNQLLVSIPIPGKGRTVFTIFLSKQWINSRADIETTPEGIVLVLESNGQSRKLPLDTIIQVQK